MSTTGPCCYCTFQAESRLRYEIRRKFTPYVDAERAGRFGSSKEPAQAVGEDVNGIRFIAELRFWI